MEKPKTNMEKNACKDAVAEVIKKETDVKQTGYEGDMERWISLETRARSFRKDADDLKEKLGLTEKDIKEVFD